MTTYFCHGPSPTIGGALAGVDLPPRDRNHSRLTARRIAKRGEDFTNRRGHPLHGRGSDQGDERTVRIPVINQSFVAIRDH